MGPGALKAVRCVVASFGEVLEPIPPSRFDSQSSVSVETVSAPAAVSCLPWPSVNVAETVRIHRSAMRYRVYGPGISVLRSRCHAHRLSVGRRHPMAKSFQDHSLFEVCIRPHLKAPLRTPAWQHGILSCVDRRFRKRSPRHALLPPCTSYLSVPMALERKYPCLAGGPAALTRSSHLGQLRAGGGGGGVSLVRLGKQPKPNWRGNEGGSSICDEQGACVQDFRRAR